MNLISRMKKLLLFVVAVGLLAAPCTSLALNYAPTRLLLVFRADGFSDVEIDLGPVSAYTGLAKGTKLRLHTTRQRFGPISIIV